MSTTTMSTPTPTPTVSLERLNETRAPQALVAVILCPLLALITVVLRLYTRTFLLKKVFWEDYMIIVAMVGPLPVVWEWSWIRALLTACLPCRSSPS